MSQNLRVALVCDWLTTSGGAEKVLLELHHMYPDAPIYTSQYSKKGINWFNDADVRTGWLQIFPRGLRKFLGPLRQLYFSHLDLSDYDVVISVTGAEAKAVRTKPKDHQKTKRNAKKHPNLSLYHTSSKKSIESVSTGAYHLCFCHVPTQYYWQMYDQYLENPGFGFLNPLVRFFFKLLVKPLRQADYRSAQQPDQFVTISRYAQDQIQRYYHRAAVIVPPPVEVKKFTPSAHSKASSSHNQHPQSQSSDYYIIACRQVTWKRVDLAIEACKKLHLPLKVVGDGSEHQHLVQLAVANPSIEFIPWVNTGELAELLQHAKAYIFPSLEPFGVAAVEALAAGCPVVALSKGGSQDFITDRVNGLLFSEQIVDSLVQALQDFQHLRFDRVKVSQTAQPFAVSNFRQSITDLVARATSQDGPTHTAAHGRTATQNRKELHENT